MKQVLVQVNVPIFHVSTWIQLLRALEVNPQDFFECVKYAPQFYYPIQLPKRTGGFRTISAPTEQLKKIQRSILDNILSKVPLPSCAYGLGAGKSIVENATAHLHGRYLTNIDLVNFFPSIDFKVVRTLFQELGFSDEIANTLTRLTTLNYSVPQGAPTSPYLAALSLNNLDARIMRLCLNNRLLYTRYFDDITISGTKRAHEVLDTLEKIIRHEGYAMHRKEGKLTLSGPGDTKKVTGLLIKDGKVTPPNAKELLEYLHLLHTQGPRALSQDNLYKEKATVMGKISFMKQVDPVLGTELQAVFEQLHWW